MNFLNKKTKQRGFTFMEVITSLAIIALVFLIVTSFQKDVWVYHRTLSNTLLAQQEAKRSLKIIVKELRTATPSSNGSYALGEAATSSILFYSDIDANGTQDQVRYYLATSTTGTTLKKRIIPPSGNPATYPIGSAQYSEVVHNITNSTSTPIFTYYPSSYAGTTTALSSPVDFSLVRLVKILINIEKDPNKSPVPMTLTSQVSLRNLKDNL